ncbi:ABC transporter permease [Desulfosarcina sp.]|uniref:ABC transporter permease n=1 Tax=Desulfosarcina sp. TaxID=2027861 RepID=UPI003970FB88
MQKIVIKPASGWQILNLRELFEYRDLFLSMVWRDIKVLYAQTILGFLWAIIQPLVQIILFTIVFGRVAKVPTEGIPYVLFATTAIIPWTYMSQAMTQASQSLVAGAGMIDKIYFPRLIFPMTPVLARLIDFGLSFLIIIALAPFYDIKPSGQLLYFPLFLLVMIVTVAGIGMWISALAIRFRDVRHAMPFVIRMLMFSAPIVYSSASISPKYRFIYSFNPIVAVIEGFRASILGLPIPWPFIWPGVVVSLVILLSGAYYFKRMEGIFADVI